MTKYILSNGAIVYDKAYYLLDVIKVNMHLFSESVFNLDTLSTYGSNYIDYRSTDSIQRAVEGIIKSRLKSENISLSDIVYGSTGVTLKFNYSGQQLTIDLEYIDMNQNLI